MSNQSEQRSGNGRGIAQFSLRRPRWTLLLRGVLSVAGLALLCAGLLAAALPATAAADTLLIVAPHPDDDIITSAGVIGSALFGGDNVKVVFMTNGDYSGTAVGLTRQIEAVTGQGRLGVSENDLIFLGYPDGGAAQGGLLQMLVDYPGSTDAFTSHNGISQTYGSRGLGGTDYHTYAFGFPAVYNGAHVIQDLEAIIAAYGPTDIYTTSPLDSHRDHAATYWFVRTALRNQMDADNSYHPALHKTIVHWGNDAVWPAAMNPQADHVQPNNFSEPGFAWGDRESLEVPAAMQLTNYAANPKYQAAEAHWTQGGAGAYLGRFIHRDEIFWLDDLDAGAAPGGNQAPFAAVMASSQNAADLQLAFKAIDGIVDGYGGDPGEAWREWSTNSERGGARLKLHWSTPLLIHQIRLYDRPNMNDRITAATVRFSDGSTLSTGSLPNDGSALTLDFTARVVISVELVVDSVSTQTIAAGLAEIEVYGESWTGSLTINNGDAYTNSPMRSVTLRSSFPDATMMRFSNDGATWSGWEGYAATKTGWQLSAGDGPKTVWGQYRDGTGAIVESDDSITLDTTAPSGTLAVESGNAWTTDTTVSLNSAVTDANTSLQMRFSNDGATWSAWEAYAAAKTGWTLSGGDGLKTVYGQYRDAAGNVRQTSDTITLDTTAPSGFLAIAGGNQWTTVTTVSLDSAVTGAAAMRFSNNGSTWSDWEDYVAGRPGWSLPAGDGSKTVWAQYRDDAGNVLQTTDTITLDNTAPSGSLAIAGGAQWTTSAAVSLDSSVAGGAAQMRFSNDGSSWSAWDAYAATKTGWTLSGGDGLKTVHGQYRDAAGNVFQTTDTITLDGTAPAGELKIEGGNTWTRNQNVTLDSAVTDANLPLQMRFSSNGSTWSVWEDYVATRTGWPLSAGDGLKTVHAQYRDAVGNAFETSDTIILDANAPAGTMTIQNGAAFVAAATVTIDSDVTDASEMRFRDADGSWSGWETYAIAKTWTLSPGDGIKTVEAEYRTSALNPVTLSDTIHLDSTAPQTTAAGVGSGWHHSAVVMRLLAADGGSGVQRLRVTIDGVEQPAPADRVSLQIAAPTSHSNDGLHAVAYSAQDAAGNWEATKTLEVGIDTRKPTPKAAAKASVKRSKMATIKFQITDAAPNGGSAEVTIKVKSLRGKTLKAFNLKNVAVNAPQKYQFRCYLEKGSYRFSVYATDAAGNQQSRIASNMLVVK
jgi:LmbE family N-acetylglucosaminyl deacetylase